VFFLSQNLHHYLSQLQRLTNAPIKECVYRQPGFGRSLTHYQAHFLRTRFPEVDISGDLIRSQITEDTLRASELAKFDPFEGNILDIAVDHEKAKYLVFPTGELSTELSKSIMLYARGLWY
jgi:hypothetical protein